jgi:hypothetical protein
VSKHSGTHQLSCFCVFSFQKQTPNVGFIDHVGADPKASEFVPHGTQMNLRRFHLGMAMVNKQLSSGAPYLRVD